jgi:sugar lactone lactonase YvrE
LTIFGNKPLKIWHTKIVIWCKYYNKVIVVYDSATGEKDVIHRPSNSQSLDFATVEVISRDNIIPSADLKNKYLDFSKQHGWKESGNSVFRVNTAEGYEAPTYLAHQV